MEFNVKKKSAGGLLPRAANTPFCKKESIIDRRIDQPIVARPGLRDAS